jgi:hypothetical protein
MRHSIEEKQAAGAEPALWLAGKSGNAIMKATEIQQKKRITHGSGKNAKTTEQGDGVENS